MATIACPKCETLTERAMLSNAARTSVCRQCGYYRIDKLDHPYTTTERWVGTEHAELADDKLFDPSTYPSYLTPGQE